MCLGVAHADWESMQRRGNLAGDRSARSSQTSLKVQGRVLLKYLIASFHIVRNADWI